MLDRKHLFDSMKRVNILSEHPAPGMDIVKVHVHLSESGTYKNITVGARRPTYFEKIMLSTVYETTPATEVPEIAIDSLRSIARKAFYRARTIGLSIRKPLGLTGPLLDMSSVEPNNMAHLLLNVIPYCLYARKVVGSDLQFRLRKVNKPFSTLLDIFKISRLLDNRKAVGNIVKIRGTRGLSVYDLLDTFDCNGINFLPDVYENFDFAASTRFAKVFFARRAPRAIINQAEIESVVAKHGYQTIFMEDYSVMDQLSIGAQTKQAIAIHGAAMSFLVMNKQIESLIELLPSHFYNEFYPVCLNSRVARYIQILPEFDPRVSQIGWKAKLHFQNLPFAVDAGLLDRILSQND